VKVQHTRHAIPDVGVPRSREVMSGILAALREANSFGEITYVHCWGGVGRTGTVVGCFLVERGESPVTALATVQRLFLTMSPEKVARHRTGSPENPTQREYVLAWR